MFALGQVRIWMPPASFQLLVSTDGAAWTSCVSGSSVLYSPAAAVPAAAAIYACDPGTAARYIKVSTPTDTLTFCQLEAYVAACPPSLCVPSPASPPLRSPLATPPSGRRR